MATPWVGTGLSRLIPKGSPISDELWESRHRAVIRLLWLHIVGLGIYGVVRGFGFAHLTAELGAIVVVTITAHHATTRLMQASLGTLGLVSCSGLLVHISGGLIEAHFHFFIVIVLVTL